LSAVAANPTANAIEKLTKAGQMTDVAPVPRDAPAPMLLAVSRAKQRFDALTAKASTLLSYAVMVGLLALPVALQHGRSTGQTAGFSVATSTPALSASPSQPIPDVRSRTVTTVRISGGPKREIEPAGAVLVPEAPASKPASTTAMVPPIKRVVPVTPPLPKIAEVFVPTPAEKSAPAASVEKPAVDALTETLPEVVAEPTGWPEVELAAALRQCTAILADQSVQFEHANPIRQGSCGTPAPIKLKAVGKLEVSLANPATMTCAVAAAVGRWVDGVLQPAAKEIFSSPVVKLIGTGSYTCRNRNGAVDGPISEHAFANAFDVSGFVLADGRTINVLGGWGRVVRDDVSTTKVAVQTTPTVRPPLAPESRSALKGPPVVAAPQPVQVASTPAPNADGKPENASDAKFLRRIHGEACGVFSTVLGPEANDAHRNHLHFDLKDRKGKSYCQ
jgi:hypothetical protein